MSQRRELSKDGGGGERELVGPVGVKSVDRLPNSVEGAWMILVICWFFSCIALCSCWLLSYKACLQRWVMVCKYKKRKK